ncbi:MAG: hypothetical protein ACM31L_16940 [Actinomycetota bacterium]
MTATSHIAAGVYGAWRLARRDPSGLAWIDGSVQGFWTSFWAAALVAPGFFALQALAGSFDDGLARPLLVQLIGYVIGWTAFPLAMAHISEGLGKWGNYTRYIAAYNWSAVVQMGAFLPVAVLAHLFPGSGTAMLDMSVTVVLLVYQAYVAHVALGVGPGTAAGIVVLDVLMGGLVQMATDRLIG